MKKITKLEERCEEEYQKLWSNPERIHRSGENAILGWHFGYYEKGIKEFKQAVIHMNNYIYKLLELNEEKKLKILDAGCGVGATLIYLAKKCPKTTFYGITLAPKELEIAEKIKKNNKIENIEFLQNSYNNTGFPNNNFDGIFALESISYSKDINLAINEMKRILKAGGKIVIVDIFRKYDTSKFFIRHIQKTVLKEKGCLESQITIDAFKTCLKSKGFKNIKSKNLIKSKNIKLSHLYGFLFLFLFNSLLTRFSKSISQKKSYSFVICLKFLFKFVFKYLEIVFSKPGYYCITAVG